MYSFKTLRLAIVLFSLLSVTIIGCSTPASTPTSAPTNVPPTVAPAPTNTIAAAVPTNTTAAANAPGATATSAAVEPTATAATSNADAIITLVVVPEKSEARYRVREQLAGFDLPNDAVGRTRAITGQIVGKMDGSIDSANSQFVVDVRTLRSDQGARDNFIQRTPLQTSQFPNVTFVPTSAPGLPLLVPSSGAATFQLIGNLTIKDFTKPVTWEASCQLESNQTEGTCTATTSFTFADFNLEQPRVQRVLSIQDTIKLEVDLYLQRVNP